MPEAGETSSVMFVNLPTVEELTRSRANFLNEYMLDLDPFAAWTVVAYDPRRLLYGEEDRRAMDVTNYDAIREELVSSLQAESGDDSLDLDYLGNSYRLVIGSEAERREAERVEAEYAAVLANGAAELDASSRVLVFDAARFPDTLDRMRELASSLQGYPLLDEEAYSALEWEAWEEYAPQAFMDEVRRDNGPVTDLTATEEDAEDLLERIADNADDILPILAQHLDYYYGFSGEYSPNFLAILADLLTAGRTDDYDSVRREAAELAKILNYCSMSRTIHTEDRCAVPDCPSNISEGQGKFLVDT